MECYIKELKYRRDKNDRIESLDKENKRLIKESAHMKDTIRDFDMYIAAKSEELRHMSSLKFTNEGEIERLKRRLVKEQDRVTELLSLVENLTESRSDVYELALDQNTEIKELVEERDELLELAMDNFHRPSICPEYDNLSSKLARTTDAAFELKRLSNELKAEISEHKRQNDSLRTELSLHTEIETKVKSLKLQLAAEKRISQKYARDLHDMVKQQATLSAM